MEKGTKSVRYSTQFKLDVMGIFSYGFETFGKNQAEKYQADIYRLVQSLDVFYSIYPECRHLPTKSKKYRWIILESHLIIYRILDAEIQVLRIIHSKRSISKVKSSRKIKISGTDL
jgi:plasmid stabilization system protein ParE